MSINYEQYINDALRTESKISTVETHGDSFLAALQLFIMASNLLDIYKRQVFYNKPVDSEQLQSTLSKIVELASNASNLSPRNSLDLNSRLLHSSLGFATEAGELLDAVISPLTKNQPIDNVNLMEELGDFNWYQAILLDEARLELEEVLNKNISKLKKRFPQRFTKEGAINRDLNSERSALEGEGE